MDIEVIPEMQLTQADEARINALLLSAFDDSFGDRSFHQQRHHLRLILRSGDAIIGHMALCYRSVRMGDALVSIIGLAEVATAPETRGRGIASALLKEAIKIAKDSAAQFFVLMGDRPIYAGHGFFAAGNPMTYTELYGASTGAVVTKVSSDVMVMPLTDLAWDADAPVDLLGFSF